MKRRDFIATGSLAAPELSTIPSSSGFSSALGANEKINLGVIGTGARGSGMVHFLRQIENVEVIALCDVLPFRLERGMEAAGGTANGHTDYTNYQRIKMWMR